jgi:hypothetical protein
LAQYEVLYQAEPHPDLGDYIIYFSEVLNIVGRGYARLMKFPIFFFGSPAF